MKNRPSVYEPLSAQMLSSLVDTMSDYHSEPVVLNAPAFIINPGRSADDFLVFEDTDHDNAQLIDHANALFDSMLHSDRLALAEDTGIDSPVDNPGDAIAICRFVYGNTEVCETLKPGFFLLNDSAYFEAIELETLADVFKAAHRFCEIFALTDEVTDEDILAWHSEAFHVNSAASTGDPGDKTLRQAIERAYPHLF